MHFLGKKPLLCAYMGHFHAMKTAKELDNLINVNFIKNNFFLKMLDIISFATLIQFLTTFSKNLLVLIFFAKKTGKQKNNGINP